MTQQPPSADDVLMGGGVPAAVFKDVGTVWGGKIVSPPKTHHEHEVVRTKDGWEKGDPKYFPSGDPIYGLTVDVQTNQRTDADDNGVRRIWIEGKRLKEAVRDAVRAAGASSLQVGGTLWVKFEALGERVDEYMNPPKLWAAKYEAPAGPASQADVWNQGQQAAPAPAPQAAPAYQPPAAPPTPAPAPSPAPGGAWGSEPPF